MEKFVITALALAVPAYFYTWLIRSIDRFEKEPVRYLIAAFAWGALPAVILALILEVILSIPVAAILGKETLSAQLIDTAVSAPVVEEVVKAFAVMIIFLTCRREFDGWVDGIVYGGVTGFGFAYVENILYLMGTSSWSEWGALFFLRTIVFGGLHGFWTAITGASFGLARYMHGTAIKVFTIACGLIVAIAGHLIHNGALVLAESTEGATIAIALVNYTVLVFVMFLLWLLAGFVERSRLKTCLQDEVPNVLSAQAYAAICDRQAKKALSKLGMTPAQIRQFLHIAAKLTQKKLQFSKMGEEYGNSAEIIRLRHELKSLGA